MDRCAASSREERGRELLRALMWRTAGRVDREKKRHRHISMQSPLLFGSNPEFTIADDGKDGATAFNQVMHPAARRVGSSFPTSRRKARSEGGAPGAPVVRLHSHIRQKRRMWAVLFCAWFPTPAKGGLEWATHEFTDGEEDEGLQEVVEIVGIAQIGARVFDDLRDGRRVELTGFFKDGGGQGAAELHGAGTALFERSIVEEGVGIGVENFVGELRWHRSIDGDGLDAAVTDGFKDAAEAVDVHGLVHHVFHHLFHQGVVGNPDIAFDVFKAGGYVGEDGGEEIIAAHALNLRRNLLAVLKAEECEGAVGVPTEAGGEDGRAGEHGLLKDVLDGFRLEEVEDIGEGEAVLFGERDVDAVVGGRGLELEVEAAAEALAQGQSPGAVDARSEGCMETSCMPPPSSKKRSAMMVRWVGTAPRTVRPSRM